MRKWRLEKGSFELAHRSIPFLFLTLVFFFFLVTGLQADLTISPPPIDPGLISCGTYLPLNQQVSYLERIGQPSVYWTDYIHLNVQSSGEFGNYYAGVLLKFDSSRLPEGALSRLRSARIYLTMAAPEEASLPEKVYLWRVDQIWGPESFDSDCEPRYVNGLPVSFCYDSPQSLIDPNQPDIGYNDQDHVEWLPLSYAEGRYALAIDVTELIREGFPPGGFYLVAEGLEHELLFYGAEAPSPALKAVLQVYYDSPCQEVVCGDGVCDYLENCEADCAIPEDLDSPSVTLTVAPSAEKVSPDVNLALVARAQDAQGIASITIYDQNNATLSYTCESGTECSLIKLAREFGLGGHHFCAQARDVNGNLSLPACEEVWIGSKTPPQITLPGVPDKVHLGELVKFDVIAEDEEGLVYIKMMAGSPIHPWEEVAYSPTAPESRFRTQFYFHTCSYPVRANDYVIQVIAKDAEGLIAQKTLPLEVITPVQAQYGLKPANFPQTLTFPQMVKTFGEEDVFATVTICGEIAPVLFKCVNNDYCHCYIATPDSMTAHLLHGSAQTLIWEYILDALSVGDDILNYLGVDSLVDLGVPTLSSLIFYPFYHEAASQGSCTGFVMTVANALAGKINPLAPGEVFEAPPGQCLNVLTQVGQECIADYVGYHQGAVVSKEFISHVLQQARLSVRENLNLILRDLRQGKHPGVMIVGFPEGGDCSKLMGHTMLVDWAMEFDSGTIDLYVYDPNRPAMSGKIDPLYPSSFDPGFDYCRADHYPYIRIFEDGHFMFEFSSGDLWMDNACEGSFGSLGLGANLIYVPPSLLTKENFELPLNLEDVLLFVAAQADVSVSDTEGHQISTSGGGEMPGALLLPLPMGGENFALLALPPGKTYQVQLEGRGERSMLGIINGQAGQQIALFGRPGSAATLKLFPVGPALGLEIEGPSFEGAVSFLTKTSVPAQEIFPEGTGVDSEEEVPMENLYLLRGRLPEEPLKMTPYPDGGLYFQVPTGGLELATFTTKVGEGGEFVHYEKSIPRAVTVRFKPLLSGTGLEEAPNPEPPTPESWENWEPTVPEEVKALINGQGGRVFLSRQQTLRVTLSAHPAEEGRPADYFLWAEVPGGACYCYRFPDQWQECSCEAPQASYQGGLASFEEIPILEVPSSALPAGTYRLFFAIDKAADGHLGGNIIRDEVEFEIAPE